MVVLAGDHKYSLIYYCFYSFLSSLFFRSLVYYSAVLTKSNCGVSFKVLASPLVSAVIDFQPVGNMQKLYGQLWACLQAFLYQAIPLLICVHQIQYYIHCLSVVSCQILADYLLTHLETKERLTKAHLLLLVLYILYTVPLLS